jgi:amidophosphoribosyltransferase
MFASTGTAGDRFCAACFTGEYPIEIPESVRRGKMALETAVPPL